MSNDGVIRFQRIIEVLGGALVLNGFCRIHEVGNCCARWVSLELIVVDRQQGRALALSLDTHETQELLKSLLEFAGEARLGETG